MNPRLGEALLEIARRSIAKAVAPERAAPATDFDAEVGRSLSEPGAVFVTLTIEGDLRGCIGSLQAHRCLGDDCARNAVAAALDDPRFPPLQRRELDEVVVEVSVLSPSVEFPCESEADACAKLEPRRHGVILSWRGHRATFLPQVWEQLPDPRRFLAALKRKAGLADDFWAPDLELRVYRVDHVKEDGK